MYLNLKKLLCLKQTQLHTKHEQCIRFCVTYSGEAFMHFKRKGLGLLFIRRCMIVFERQTTWSIVLWRRGDRSPLWLATTRE